MRIAIITPAPAGIPTFLPSKSLPFTILAFFPATTACVLPILAIGATIFIPTPLAAKAISVYGDSNETCAEPPEINEDISPPDCINLLLIFNPSSLK